MITASRHFTWIFSAKSGKRLSYAIVKWTIKVGLGGGSFPTATRPVYLTSLKRRKEPYGLNEKEEFDLLGQIANLTDISKKKKKIHFTILSPSIFLPSLLLAICLRNNLKKMVWQNSGSGFCRMHFISSLQTVAGVGKLWLC